MLKRFALLAVIALAVVGLLLAVACGGGGKKKVTFRVKVDGRTDQFVGAFIAYFPKDVQVHAGDQIDFDSSFNGEPHTVTLGTNVDAVFNLIAEMCPNGGLADPACQEVPPEQYADQYFALDGRLPQFFPEGEGDLIQAAAAPCYLGTGDPPADGSACTEDQQNQPEFDGTQTYYNSGFLPEGAVFEVKLAKNIAPGTYYYYCLLHREFMSGTVEVVAEDVDAPNPSEVEDQGDDAFTAMVDALKPAADQLESLTPEEAQAGAFSEDVEEAIVNEFGPKEISIPEGGSVTWNILGPHTISINVPAEAQSLITRGEDGLYHLNEQAGAPSNSPAPPEPDPNALPDAPVVIDAGTWDGESFLNSGIIESFGDPAYQYKVTFAKAGSYNVICLIHPGMGMTVTVGD